MYALSTLEKNRGGGEATARSSIIASERDRRYASKEENSFSTSVRSRSVCAMRASSSTSSGSTTEDKVGSEKSSFAAT
jgi:hypothetical protein